MRSPFSLVILGAFLGLTRALDLPVITLPWGKYQAEVFADDEDILLFRNVHFGKEPPRFGAPSFPDWKDDAIQSPDRGTTCIQINTEKLRHPPVGGSPFEDAQKPPSAQTEDCLFLDIYVPKWAVERKEILLPVTVWIYGGGYAFASNYNSIFIAGNYRVGAFGWLAGDYMQQVGQPNAGLYDQALLFEWVQKYIDQAHGDKEFVSAWGESAGAGSILYYLDNSPGGKLDTIFRNFSRLAGCEFAYDIDCLRKAPVTDLAEANTKLFNLVRQTGLFPVGPAIDGKHWKNIQSGIISHVANEGYLFSPKDIDNAAKYNAFLNEFLPGSALAPQRAAIKNKYDCKKAWLGEYQLCVAAIIAHAVFNCNTRDLATAYPDISYMMEYAFPAEALAYHGLDLIPLFVTNATETEKLMGLLDIDKNLIKMMAGLIDTYVRKPYQNYFAALTLLGDPNALGTKVHWPPVADDGNMFSGVLKVDLAWGSEFKIGLDWKNSKAKCSFWAGLAKEIVAAKTTYGDSHGALLEAQYPINSGNEL
uniref:Carboxylesterase type B domain-containing protein n=1 Tax=Bionectria ochroleuca TaxID=29856 RepID=A0A0B7KQM8_BIOOC